MFSGIFSTAVSKHCGSSTAVRKGSRGSTAVEAALLYPLILTVVFGFIFTSLRLYGSVREDAVSHRAQIIARITEEPTPESVLRAGWILARISSASDGNHIQRDPDEEDDYDILPE